MSQPVTLVNFIPNPGPDGRDCVTLGKLYNFFIQQVESKKQTMPTVVGYQERIT